MTTSHPKDTSQSDYLVDPVALRILLVDANSSSEAKLSDLLQSCNYQVTACKTSQEAIQVLKEEGSGFDLILKEHCPASGSNACRLLKRAQTEPVLHGIPIIVASTTEDRDVMVNCLQLGAADYMMKPLRPTELRNLWARVYWWRRASYLQQQSSGSDTPMAVSLSQMSGSSLQTIRENQEAQERHEDDRSGEGSAPNGNGSGSGENGSKGLGSKDGSEEDILGWSRNLVKPGPGQGTSGEGAGNSGSKPPLAFDPHSPAEGAAGLLELRKQGSDTSHKSRQDRSSLETATAVEAAPFDSPEAQKQASPARLPTRKNGKEHLPEASLDGAASGFRAYRSKGARKRPPPNPERPKPQRHSCSSGHTASLEAPPEKMRRTESQYQARSSSLDLNEGSNKPPTSSRAPEAGSGAGPHTNSHAGSQMPTDSSQTQTNFSPFFPFGVMPNPFTMAQLWNQYGSRPSDAEMAQHFAQLAQQGHNPGQAAAMCQGEQQQQQMLHNQLMLQHSLMMLHSLPGNPFTCFSGFENASANQAANIQREASQSNVQAPLLRPQLESALPTIQQAMHFNRSRSWEAHQSQTQRPQAGRPGGHKHVAEQSFPSSGRREAGLGGDAGAGIETGVGTGTGTVTGNTLGAGNSGNATGATSHTTAQVGLDGCLAEPSQQERRAQALHKYKQKRKNLCFTKKIRYESRKQLAQARPRVKGQFVRVGDIADAVDALTEARKDSGWFSAEAGTTIQTYVAGKKDGETQMIKLPEQSGVENLKAAQVYDESTESDEIYEEDTDSVSPARLAQESNARAEESNRIATKVDAPKPLPMASQA